VKERLSFIGVKASELRFDLIGVDSLHGHELSITRGQPYEVRLRVIGRTDTIVDAKRIGNEVETLYTNGPAGGGGATQSVRSILAVQSVLVPRELVQTRIELVEA
jgi:hypothetical protein